jgi:hypothetical protein
MLFLADAATTAPALDASNPVIFLGLLIGGLYALVSLIDTVDGFVQRRKRTPAIEAEFARKEDVAELAARHDREIQRMREEAAAFRGEISGKVSTELTYMRIAVEKLTTSINKDFNTLYRALGKVEGVTLEDRRDD